MLTFIIIQYYYHDYTYLPYCLPALQRNFKANDPETFGVAYHIKLPFKLCCISLNYNN